MLFTEKHRQFAKPLAMALAVMLTFMGALTFWLDEMVEKTILTHAEESASSWGDVFIDAVPDVERLVETGQPTPEQIGFIDAAVFGSDIFRFKIFDQNGVLVFVSDEGLFQTERQVEVTETAAQVIETLASNISVKDGSEKPDRPDWYVEAYIPIIHDAGHPIGAFEVYVDVSGLASALRAQFSKIGFYLLLGASVIYLVPTVALIFKNHQLRKRDGQLKQLSEVEPLTGLLNRGSFTEGIETLFSKRKRTGETIGIFFIDLDKFKQVNDKFGHEFGDKLLIHVASVLRQSCREADLVARIGGDEFVILMPDIDATELDVIGARLMENIKAPFVFGTSEVWPSLSVGAHLSLTGESEAKAMHCADVAVYRAKADGRGRVVTYTQELEKIELRRKNIETAIANGLDGDGFFLEFQPIFDRSGVVKGFETLSRLQDADGNRISPAEFIPVAEDAAFIEEIGSRALRQAIETAASWPDHVFVAVNLSAHEFRSGGLPKYVEDLLNETGVAPSRICLELTESIMLNDDESVTDQLIGLKALGVDLAIDDFGTGYSSLGYLWKYKFDRIKIDKVFLEGYEFDNERYTHIIETIILLGHQLQMSVTVEGVETADQLERMRDLGCDLFQGFLMSQPISQEKSKALITEQEAAERKVS